MQTEMITFSTSNKGPAQCGRLVYRRYEYSFDTEDVSYGRSIAVVVNDVELFLDEDARVIAVSGYCPDQSWKKTQLSPPAHSQDGLVVTSIDVKEAQDGVAFSLTDTHDSWPVYVNREGWVCIGDPADHGEQAVKFAPGSVAVLRGDSLIALWLHPFFEGRAARW